jgi:long-chain-acyl-CoA dehydrogenase
MECNICQDAGNRGVICPLALEETAKDTSLLVLETENEAGFARKGSLAKMRYHAADCSEFFCDSVKVPFENILESKKGKGVSQMTAQLREERPIIACDARGAMNDSMARTTAYPKNRQAFDGSLMHVQNSRFKRAEYQTKPTVAHAGQNDDIAGHLRVELRMEKAAMAKYWITDTQDEVIDACFQLHGDCGFMAEYDVAEMWGGSHVEHIYGGSNEIMKASIVRAL